MVVRVRNDEQDVRRQLVVLEEPVGVRQAREDAEAREHARDQRPQQDEARDGEVEDGERDLSRAEGDIRAFGRPSLRDVELGEVADACGDDRVDADAGDVRSVEVAPARRPLRVRAPNDVEPGPRDGALG